MQTFAVIMAGGRGERFWPMSRATRPKQLLPLLGELTLIEQTVARLTPVFPPERIVIVTNRDYVAPMRQLLTTVPAANILGEPAGRNTAPCVAMAAAYVRSIAADEPVIALFPADQAVRDTASFSAVISDCTVFAASSGHIVTIGIKPSFPSTGYGYIELGDPFDQEGFHKVRAFHEKPDPETAERYVASGKFRWNGGMFFMSHKTLTDALTEHAPDLMAFHDTLLNAFRQNDWQTVEQAYSEVRKISIDYAVMEKAPNIAVAEARFDWDDVGSWTSMRNQFDADHDGNIVRGLHAGVRTNHSVIFNLDGENDGHIVATLGLENMVVVRTKDATLVCPADETQKIGELLKYLREHDDLQKFI